MRNMSYCRFQNTLEALQECADHLEDELSEEEDEARHELLNLCEEMLRTWGRAENVTPE